MSIDYIELHQFDETKLRLFKSKRTKSLSFLHYFYEFPDKQLRRLNIKTNFINLTQEFNKKGHPMIDLNNDTTNVLKDVLFKIDQKTAEFIKREYDRTLFSRFNLSLFVSTTQFSEAPLSNDNKLLKLKFNNTGKGIYSTHIIKHNSKSKIQETNEQYTTLNNFTQQQWTDFVSNNIFRKYMTDYSGKYIIHPQIVINTESKNVFNSMNVIYAEFKHNKSFVKSVVDSKEEIVSTNIINEIKI